jgi:16S rRNA (guanine527-N7)-methyltransferase
VKTAEQVLLDGLRQLGIGRAETAGAALLRFADLLLSANRETNLIGAKNLDDLVRAHFLDSLAPLAGFALAQPVLDVGSGAGLPGIVAAIVYPDRRFVLLEPRSKRAAFLKAAAASLGLGNVSVEQVAAETAGRATWRGRAGTALIRAVAKPPVALELGLPLLRLGGRLVLYMGRVASPDERTGEIIGLLGGRLKEARPVKVPYLDAVRHAWVIVKERPTPLQFPRRSGLPSKQPLNSS